MISSVQTASKGTFDVSFSSGAFLFVELFTPFVYRKSADNRAMMLDKIINKCTHNKGIK